MEERIRNVSKELGITVEEARLRAIKIESDRKAFIRKYFNADIEDPLNYDLVINTGNLSVDDAMNTINSVLNR
jgi:cytidylate kinase